MKYFKNRILNVCKFICITNLFVGQANAQSLPSVTVQTPKKFDSPVAEPSPAKSKTSLAPGKSKHKQEPPIVNLGNPAPAAIKAPPLPPPSKVTQDFYNAFRSGNIELAEILLQNGADINCKNCGETPLLHQSLGFNPPPVKNATDWLLTHNADINLKDNEGRTALHKLMSNAIETSNFSNKLTSSFKPQLQRLLAAGANPSIADDKGVTPLHKAAAFIHIASAQDNARTTFGYTIISEIVAAGGNVNSVTNKGYTVLMAGIAPDLRGNKACNSLLVEQLINLGADVSIKARDGATAYSIAYDLAVSGAKPCNGLLGMLNPETKPTVLTSPKVTAAENNNAPTSKTVALPTTLSTVVAVPTEIAGNYTGVLHFKTPKALSAGMTGVIESNGMVTIKAPFNVSTLGRVSKFEGNHLQMRLKDIAPSGMRFADGEKESVEYDVVGKLNNGIYRGSFNFGDDSGEYILCPQATATLHAECSPTVKEAIGSTVGGILGAFSGLLKNPNSKQ